MEREMSKSKNGSNGPEAARSNSIRKAATSGKGRQKQPRGSSDHNTKPRYSKPLRKGKTDNMDIEF